MSKTSLQSAPVLIRGIISNLHRREVRDDFLFTQKQKNMLSTAITSVFFAENQGVGASLASMGGITRENADCLTFNVDEKNVEICVWASNFAEGDEVSVVAENIEGTWKGYAIHRESDGLIAVYPHCTRGRYAHYKATLRWILLIAAITYVVVMTLIFVTSRDWDDFVSFATLGVPAIFGMTSVFAIRGAWKFKKIVRMAERIFTTFGWPHPKWVDLRSGVKKKKLPDDPPTFGISLFRYQPKN
jgi:hypothetical protein